MEKTMQNVYMATVVENRDRAREHVVGSAVQSLNKSSAVAGMAAQRCTTSIADTEQ